MCDTCQEECELDAEPMDKAFRAGFASLPSEGQDTDGWMEEPDDVDEDGWPL